MGRYILVSVIAYLLGSISFAVIFGKIFGKKDVRKEGSKNAGSTNVLRTVGKKAAILTLLCDVLKGVGAVLIALAIASVMNVSENEKLVMVQLSGIFVIIGHTLPIFFKFKGGKGVATALGVLLITNWHIGLICLVYALILMLLSQTVSLGSIAAAVLFPTLVITGTSADSFITPGNYIFFSIVVGLLIIWNHRANIKRLVRGEENRINFHKSKKVRETERKIMETIDSTIPEEENTTSRSKTKSKTRSRK